MSNSDNDEKPAKDITDLPYRDRLFVDLYTDPSNDKTYGNATQAYAATHPKASIPTCNSNGTKKLQSASVRAYVESKLAELGAGSDVRLSKLQEVILGSHKKVVTTTGTKLDENGNPHEYTTVVESTPSASERIKAIDLVNRMVGLYDANKETATAARREYERLKRGK